MDFYDKLIDLRITLASTCDGFSVKDASKNLLLSNKIKVLHLLSQRDMIQGEFISILAMAKSNLANLLKSMIEENLIENYRNVDRPKNINYKITSKGLENLKEYKNSLKSVFSSVCNGPNGQLENNIDEMLRILKGEN